MSQPVTLQPHGWEFGARSGGETLTFIAADQNIRPLRDQIVVEPLDVIHSRYIIVAERTKPLRGKVLAVGPGHYPKQYDHPEKHKRKRMWEGKRFQPTEVKVGDIVELGGSEIGGYAFEQFQWGSRRVLICREADVAGVEDPTRVDAR